MEVTSYNNIYLENIAVNIGTMFQYATNEGFDPKYFWDVFVHSQIAKEIENGNPKYLVGCSAIDLLNFVLKEKMGKHKNINPKHFLNPNRYYWVGYVLTYYQCYKNISFNRLNKLVNIQNILDLYDTLHEADISKFFKTMDEYISSNKNDTNLKQIRLAAGLSQSQLAEKANVSIRNIQMYEQRKNDINKAQVDILLRISKTLGCFIENLLE